jgi:hypothetical protein
MTTKTVLVRVVASVALLTCVAFASSGVAAIPFNWTDFANTNSPRTTTVPNGMLWHVTYASGYTTTRASAEEPGIAAIANNDGGSFGPQTLFLAPRLVFQGSSGALFAIDSPVSGYFVGEVQSTIANRASVRVDFSLTGTLKPLLTGDFNGDSAVNAADYTAFRDGLGPYWQPSDYTDWVAAYGASASGAIAVPEPSAFVLVSTVCLLVRRRVRASRC